MTWVSPAGASHCYSADLFEVAGRKFLLYADRLSSWPCIAAYGSDTTAQATIKFIWLWFRDLGVPVHLRTDGGLQFTSSTFRIFLEKWGIIHEISSPHFPQSNGHAEANDKNVKHLILKVAPSGKVDSWVWPWSHRVEKYARPYRETPAQMIMGIPLRSLIPAHSRGFAS